MESFTVAVGLLMLIWTTVPALAQTTLTITSLSLAGSLAFTNVFPGHHYALQQAGDLSAAWTNALPALSDIQATDSTMTVSVPTNAQQRWYRIEDLGLCCANTGGADYDLYVYTAAGVPTATPPPGL